jgi:hypothetical protein
MEDGMHEVQPSSGDRLRTLDAQIRSFDIETLTGRRKGLSGPRRIRGAGGGRRPRQGLQL